MINHWAPARRRPRYTATACDFHATLRDKNPIAIISRLRCPLFREYQVVVVNGGHRENWIFLSSSFVVFGPSTDSLTVINDVYKLLILFKTKTVGKTLDGSRVSPTLSYHIRFTKYVMSLEIVAMSSC